MTTIRVINHPNPRGLPAGAEFDTDAATADRWVRRGWGAIVGVHESEQVAQIEQPEPVVASAEEVDLSKTDRSNPEPITRRKAKE